MSVKDTIQNFVGTTNDNDGEDERIDIDELDSDEIQNAINYLDAIGRSTKKIDIEEAAYYLRNVDKDVELFSAYESADERSRLDHSIVAPSNMEHTTKWHTRDGQFYQILTATSMPRLVSPGWLIPQTLSDHDVRISTHIKPLETNSVKGKLQQRLTQMKSAIQWKRKRNRTDLHEEEYEQGELKRLLRRIIEGVTKIFNYYFYIEVRGETLEEMEEVSRKVRQQSAEQGIDLTPVEGRQIEAQQAMLPVGTDPIRNASAMQLEALATTFNFIEPPVYQPGGALLGFDDSKRPVIVNRFDLSGYSKVITGKVGSGKTYSAKLTLLRELYNDTDLRIIIFDPLGDDFVDFTRKVDGTVIKFGGDDRINPLDIQPPTNLQRNENLYMTKVRSATEILKTYFSQSGRGGMTASEEGVILPCLQYAYSKCGITQDPATFSNPSPTIDDVIEGVRIISYGGLNSEESPVDRAELEANGTIERAPDRVRQIFLDPAEEYVRIAQTLVPKFESFKAGSINNNLNGRTNIELDDRIICFNMESFADTGEMPLIMHTMLDWAYQKSRSTPDRTEVCLEEVHYLLDRPAARKHLNLFTRHARHFNTGLTLISQTPDEFLSDDAKREIYDNCDIKQLFYQENVSPEVVNYFDLSEEEARFLRQAARGQNSDFSECLLSTSEHGRRRLEIYADPYDRHMLSEDLDPIGFLKQQGFIDDDPEEDDDDDFRRLKDDMPDDVEISALGLERGQSVTRSALPEANGVREVETPNDITTEADMVAHDGASTPDDGEADEVDAPKDPFRVATPPSDHQENGDSDDGTFFEASDSDHEPVSDDAQESRDEPRDVTFTPNESSDSDAESDLEAPPEGLDSSTPPDKNRDSETEADGGWDSFEPAVPADSQAHVDENDPDAADSDADHDSDRSDDVDSTDSEA